MHRKTDTEILAILLDEGEGYTLEFKESVNSDLSKELVAFANASGGRILIGVSDTGKVVGCDTSNKMLSQIQDMASACDPAVTIEIEKVTDHRILVIHIPEGANRPHRCNKGFYLRNGANSQKMSTADITAFLQSEGRVVFDEQLRTDIEWESVIDGERLNHFCTLSRITLADEKENLLCNLGVGNYRKELFYLNNTGILFFSKDPVRHLFHTSVVCALFQGTERSTILDRKELCGSIIENVDAALQYLKQHLNTRFEITGETARRKNILELPEIALREALVNAVTHRDYHEKGAQVMIEIFDDRVDIYNPGGLPKGLPLSEFGKRSLCRNPLIASLMLRCDYIEKMGTGIKRIKDAIADAKCPDVKIETDSFFTVTFPRSPEFAPTARRATGQVTTEVAGQVAGQVKSLVVVLVGEMNRSEIQSALDLKGRDNFLNNYLRPALDLKLIEMTQPNSPKSPTQKYRRTAKGKEFLDSGLMP